VILVLPVVERSSLLSSSTTRILIATTILLSCGLVSSVASQSLSNYDREAGRQMLTMIRLDIEKDYYDPSFRGIDLKERFGQADGHTTTPQTGSSCRQITRYS